MNKIRFALIPVAVAFQLHAAVEVRAQNSAVDTDRSSIQEEMRTLDAVTVTAQRREESLQDTPVAISAFSGEMLEDRGIYSVADLANNVPSLTVRAGTTDAFTPLVSLRGQSQTRSDTGKQPSVGLYYDGIYAGALALSGVSTGLIDVERVEVLRGPQGTLYGRNTPGGTVNILSNLPTDVFEGSVQMTAGNRGHYSFAGVLNVPVNETNALRLVAQFQEEDGYLRDVTHNVKIGDYDVAGLKASFRSDLTDRFQVIGRAEYTQVESNGTSPWKNVHFYPNSSGVVEARVALGLPNTPEGMQEAYSRILGMLPSGYYDAAYGHEVGGSADLAAASLEANYSISDTIGIKSITAYRNLEKQAAQDADATPFDLNACEIGCVDYDATQWTQDIQLNVDALGGRLTSVAGLYFYYLDAKDNLTYTALRNINPTGTAYNNGDFKTESAATYAQLNYELSEKWSLTAGARFTTETAEMTAHNYNDAGCAIPVDDRVGGQCLGTFSTGSDVWTWNVGADFRPTEQAMFYGKVSRGFKGGGHNPLGTLQSGSFTPFAPEFVTEYEVGAKTDFVDGRLRANLAFYHTDYTDVQRAIIVEVAGGGVASITTNAAEAKVNGVELEVSALLTDRFQLEAAASYTDAGYEEYQGVFGDRSGLPFPALPEWQGNLTASYWLPTSFGQVKLIGNVYHQSEADYMPDDRSVESGRFGIQPGYTLYNARIVFEMLGSDLSIALFGDNLSGKRYITSALNQQALGTLSVIPGKPRTYGITLTKRF